jgi:hypothetical protein
MSGHSVSWKIDRWQVDGTVACHEPEGADCRLHGGPGCECDSWEPLRDEHGKPYHEVDGYDEKGADAMLRHYMVSGYCSVAEWIDNDGCTDCYADGEHPVVDGPITVEWTDPGYSWCYADSDTALTVITERTRRQMFALLNEQGITDRAQQLAGMSNITGRDITSRTDVTEIDALAIIADLQQRKRVAERTTP